MNKAKEILDDIENNYCLKACLCDAYNKEFDSIPTNDFDFWDSSIEPQNEYFHTPHMNNDDYSIRDETVCQLDEDRLSINENESFIPSPSQKEDCNLSTFDFNRSNDDCNCLFKAFKKLIRRIGKTEGFSKRTTIDSMSDNVYSSIFAPSEIKHKANMLVQVYLHLFEETEQVKALAIESQKNAIRRDYVPLQCKINKGDKVDITLNIYGETLLMSEPKSVIWQGHFTKCSFDYFVPTNIEVEELCCVTLMTINGIPIGESKFISNIVESPQILNTEIISHKYNKVFISYAHKDEWKVKSFHEGLKLMGVEHFFDRAYLKAGDIYPQVIQDYINSADLFVLFWSENALNSEYVEKERTQALKRAFPQVRPRQAAPLSIYPMNIEPHADLPIDMKDYYHFGEL